MKLKLDNGTTLSIKLKKDLDGSIDITIAKINGEAVDSCGYLACIGTDGKLLRFQGVTSDANLTFTSANRIKESN